MGVEWIGLAEAVQVLREELAAAQESGEGESLRFEVGPVELEFAVVARRSGGGKAGIQFGVVTLGVEGGLSKEETHRIKVRLTPKDAATGRAPQVNARVDVIPPR